MRLVLALVFFFLCLSLSHPKKETFNEKIVICGVCKNVESALPFTITALQKLGSHFSDYRIFIYEDNSSDETPFLLKKWSENNPRVSVISEVIATEELLLQTKAHTKQNNPFRTELIARARNTVLKQALSPSLDDYAYVIMVDMDFKKEWNVEGILDSFRQKKPWDAICANGIDSKGRFYDRYALRTDKFLLGPELLGDEWWKKIEESYIRLKPEEGLKPVYSAFGGIAIYRRQAIQGCQYAGIVNDDLATVVHQLLKAKPDHPDVQAYFSRKGVSEEIQWAYNSGGIGAPVCCEHVTFHASMIRHGYTKIFINPNMAMFYD